MKFGISIFFLLYVALSIALLCQSHGELGNFLFVALILIVLVIVPTSCLLCRLRCLEHTGCVRIDESGLWLPSGSEAAGASAARLIGWKDLISVDTGKTSGSGKSNHLFFKFNSIGWDFEKRETLKSWGLDKIKLDLRGFPERDHSRILSAISRFAPRNRVDKHWQEQTPSECGLTYTSIWLESLGSSPRRFASAALESGTFLDRQRYEVLRLMATGGQATTYEAIDHEAKVDEGEPWHVVLKEFVIPVHGERTAVEEMFTDVEKVSRILKTVSCENIVKLYRSFVEDFRAYLVLEYVEGETLRDLALQTGCPESPVVVQLAIQMCGILERLHGQDNPVVHRDFTPDNLILTPSGKLKLIDFDVAVNENRTGPATVVGKPSYLAPEQFRGQATGLSDLYSLGATLFFLLTARDPTPISISHPRKYNPSVSETLDQVVAKATETTGAQRYQSARELSIDLQALEEKSK